MNKGKGSSFEREISRALSIYVSKGERDDIFWRTSQSGGRATVRSRSGLTTAGGFGDITALDGDYTYITDVISFELKRGYKTTDIQDMLDAPKKNSIFLEFWNQCKRDCIGGGKALGVLITKRDRRKIIITISKSFWDGLCFIQGSIADCDHICVNCKGEHLVCISFEDFMKYVPAEVFTDFVRVYRDA